MKHNRTLRRGLGILLSLVMCLSLLPATALADTPAEMADFTSDSTISAALELLGSNAEWDGENTLTLKGVNFTTSAPIAVKLPDGAIIELADGTTNTITSMYKDATESTSCGIYADGSLTIQGSGTLTVTGGAADVFSCGIYTCNTYDNKGGVTISGGTVETTGGAGNYSCGIYTRYGDVNISGEVTRVIAKAVEGEYESSGIHASDNVKISDSTVTATGGTAFFSKGIYTETGDVTISGKTADVTATAVESERNSYGIYSDEKVSISDGTVKATSGKVEASEDAVAERANYRAQSCGIFAYSGNVEIKAADVTASGNEVIDTIGYSYSYGIYSEYDVTISDSTVTAAGNTSSLDSYGIACYNVNISGSTVKATGGTAGNYSYGIYAYQNMNISGEDTDVTAMGGTADSESYGIWAGENVDISGGKVKATGDKVEASDDAVVERANYRAQSCGIKAYGYVVISYTAEVTAEGGTATGYYGESYGLYADETVTISDTAKVTANGGAATGDDSLSFGLYADETVNISDTAEVTATGGTTTSDGSESYGIFAYYYVNISGGTVTATGGNVGLYSDGIYAEYDVTISGGTVTATGGEVTGEDAESFGIESYGNRTIAISGGHVIARTLAKKSDTTTRIALNVEPDLSEYTDLNGNTDYYWRTRPEDSFKYSAVEGEYTYNDTDPDTYVEFSNGYTYTITLDSNYAGGKSSTVFTGTDGKLVSALPDATRSGSYRFDGWYTAASGGDEITTDDEFFADATVYAHWTYTGSSSGGSGGAATYAITVESAKNGAVTSSHKTASKGTTVTLTAAPDSGYALDTLTVTDASGSKVAVTEKSGKYTFTMPASKVTVKAAFAETEEENPFTDVPKGAYYFDAVLWAAENGVTGGVDDTHFAPNAACTRAQAVTFLWRAAGSPAPKSSVNPFTDVAEGSYYYDAVLWAVENGITNGTTDTTFSPNATCTRAQIVTFLWRSQKSPAAGSVNPFTDVAADAYYAGAVLWAVENGITSGTTATTFSPNAYCTRAQIVTFLYRCLG